MDCGPDRWGSVERVTDGNGMMASAKMKLGVMKNRSPVDTGKTISKEASPDSKCPICLDRFRNISYVDKCLHRFCFRCIHEWAKNKAECPLCKQPFSSIYHSVKAEDDFQQYHLRPSDTGSFGSLAGQRFRYRTTLTGDRRPDRRTSPPPDHGVMFEGLSGSVSHGNDRGFRRMVARLAARQRAQSEGRVLRTLHEQEMIQFRRMLYRRGLRVRDVRDGGRSRDTSAEFFRGNAACLHRLVPWLKRELTVLYGTHGSLVNIVQHIVMSQITRYDMQDPAVLQELRPFLLSRTEHFLHEFQSFARSPFNMEAYDQNAVYDCPAPSAEDSGDSDSSVITVSEDEAGSLETRAPAMLSQMPWDDETPGPSYSTEPPRVSSVSVTSGESDAEEETGPSTGPSAGPSVAPARVVTGEENHSASEDDCMIVGFVKPTAERTPELVQLSSDSEEDNEEETKNNCIFIRAQPQHIRFTSPPDSPSSSQSASSHQPKRATDGNRPSLDLSDARRSSSPRRSSTNHRRKNHGDSRSKRSDSSSLGHKRRSRSKDRKQSRETSSFYRYHTHLSHTHRSNESGRSHIITHYSSVRRSPKIPRSRNRSWDRSWSRERSHVHSRDRCLTLSQERSCTWSQDQSHACSRECSRAQQQDRTRSPDHSRSRSWDYSHARLGERSRARSREHSRTRLRDHSCSRLGERSSAHSWDRARSRERSRARSRERSRARSGERLRTLSRERSCTWSRSQRSCSRHRRRTPHPSPSSTHRKPRLDKPGGKRKYKSLHLEPARTKATEGPTEDRKKRSSGKRERKRRSSRSRSVEIVCEGDIGEALLKKHHRKKKKHKKKSRRKRSRERRDRKSPTVITIDSESDGHDPATNPPAAYHAIASPNITIPKHNKAELGLPVESHAYNAATDSNDANNANSSGVTPDAPVHSVSQSDQNTTAPSPNMNHSSTKANDANDANSTSIP